jgi:LmbE family N-acetylglucosaminyl deacetylase
MNTRVTIVTAHPDDAEIYAGGLIAAYAQMAIKVHIVIATNGERGGALPAKTLGKLRIDEAIAGAKILGAEVRFLELPDGELNNCANLSSLLRNAFSQILPDLILAHHPQDYHSDHRAIAEASRQAASFRAPIAWLDTMMGVGTSPTHYIDTTIFQDKKRSAILCHTSQDPLRFSEKAQLLGKFRAAQCGHDGYAEAIQHHPIYPFCDIRSLLPPPPPVKPITDRNAQLNAN